MSDSKQSRKINRFFAEFIAKLRKWLNKIGSPVRISRRFVRQLLGESRGQKKSPARGFVLPTVVMVTLLVTLLVVTTVSRSSERAQTAANARQEQVFKSAATPLVDRARAKIDALLNDERLPRTTPPEDTLDSVITADSGKYTFPDETRLQLVYNFPDTDQKINITGSIDSKEYVSTAWKFPIDTDNNGKFDSYGLYSILFRTRPPAITNRPLVPIEARTLPMDETTLASACVQAASGSNVASNGGWTLSSDNRVRKSFFVYAVTLPITDDTSFPANATNYELYNGVTSISAVELQQDRARTPQNNNAVFFEGDLELVKVATFRINGRIYTAGNLMVGANTDSPISFYQVSSSGGATNGTATTDSKLFGSCYYEKKNSEIIVAGQVVEGDTVDTDTSLLSVSNPGRVNVDLFYGAGPGEPPDTVTGGRVQIDETNQSVTDLSSKVALNDFAYNNRIAALVNQAISDNGTLSSFSKTSIQYTNASTKDPASVQVDLIKRIQDEALSSLAEVEVARRSAFEVYFRERTRRVTFGEVAFGGTDTFPSPLLIRIANNGQSATDPKELAPSPIWMLPLYKGSGFGKAPTLVTGTPTVATGFDGRGGYLDGTKGVTLATASNRLKPQATDPETVKVANESLLGDRLLVGNGLPARWLKSDATGQLDFVGEAESNYIAIATGASGVSWNSPTNAGDRYRNTRSVTLSSLGVTDRGGFWEISAALNPAVSDLSDTTKPLTDDVSPKTGGLRVVTNAGIYSSRPADTFLQRFRTGVSDDTTSPTAANSDESRMPFWNGSSAGNLITSLDERKFATTTNNYVVWSDSMPTTGGLKLDGTPDTRKGDLQMRATAIYHYKYDAFNPIGDSGNYQKPIACVSSYYDPSTPVTAKNAATLPWNQAAGGRSNNGIVYTVGITSSKGFIASPIAYDSMTGLFSGFNFTNSQNLTTTGNYPDKLAYQANLIFPNGRFANEPLREVLAKIIQTPSAELTLPQQSTLDSNLCALQILDGSVTVATGAIPTQNGAQIPHGAFRESAFLDGREVKSLNRNESLTESANGNNTVGTAVADNGLAVAEKGRADIYDLEIEQRQPLEIRATDIDMDRLRGSKISGGNNGGLNTDYLLPYSGLIYATREDALQDLSYFDKTSNDPIQTDENRRKALSSTDFLLDPTRKPSAIRLINGYRLWRSELDAANLGNTNGSLPVSITTYASYPWNDTTKGEKGLTLVSNLPVYVKAQYNPDPANASATPAFNKHTKEEFKLLLNENIVISPTDTQAQKNTKMATIWDNFYKRHADNGNGDKLDPDFACRPGQNTNCTVGDEWRPATVLADAVTVLSANYRDGYRTDGDYDLRNNANTSTSLNWQSQLNPSAEETKDSSYVLDRRRNGFFNNNFVTNARWLSPVNSDGGVGASTDLWPGAPHNASPTNGNLVSYNANGVTPIQRRLSFSEYGMELCRKFPISECTFSDWIEAGAGTTTLPDFAANGTVSTPAAAPRFISNDDSRYARRLSFLRFDDIYKDGNQQLIFAGACPGGPYWPMPIGVTDGNLDTGFTYPQAMGGLATPFDSQRERSYGVVPCPESAITVGIYNGTGNSSVANNEGRRRDRNTPLAGKANGALETQLGATVLPTPIAADITNANDDILGAVISAVEGNRSNNNAVYRRFNFTVRLNRRDLLAAGQTVRVKVTLFPNNATPGAVGSAFPLLSDPINNTKTDYLNQIYNMSGVAVDLKNKAAATVTVAAASPSPYPQIATGTPVVATGEPEDSKCAATDFCTYVTWTGPTDTTTDPQSKVLTVLVVRDSADEDQEQFRLSLDNLVTTTGTNTAKYLADNLPGARRLDGTNNYSLRRGDITLSNNSPTPNDCFPSGGTAVTNNNNDDRPRSTSQCGTTPPPDPAPSGGDSGAVTWPVFASLPTSMRSPMAMIAPPAAAYPFYHTAAPSSDIKFRRFNPPYRLDGTLGSEGGRYVWGNDINGDGDVLDTGESDTVFPDIPPSPGLLGEIPMLPGNLAYPIDNTNNQQMTNSRPANQARTLWYRTADTDSDRMGRTDRIKYNNNRNLFLNNLSFPTIADTNSRGNLSSIGRLILPDVACISLVDGTVDALCSSKSYTFGTSAPTDASTTLLNLNLPHNPHFPSDNTSLATTSTTIPASTYTVCGPSGSTQVYQATQNSLIGRTDIANTTACTATAATTEAIKKFVGNFITTTTTSGSGSNAVTTTSVTETGVLSLNLLPGNAAFKGSDPDITKKVNGVDTITSGSIKTGDLGTAVSPYTSEIDLAIRAVNTYANNKVHVVNINSIGINDGGTRNLAGKITFRANCADPVTGADSLCTPTSVRRGPSPVFIMRGDPNESINFKGLKINLDGVDPNNIFWVSSRTQSRLDIKTSSGKQLLVPGNGKDPRIAYGQRLVFSDKANPVAAPLSANTPYYVIYNNGGSGNSSVFGVSLTKPPQPQVDCSPPKPANGCPAAVIDMTGSQDFALSAEPSFIFEAAANKPNIITGNFLGNTTAASGVALTEDNTSVFAVRNTFTSFRGVRFLGLFGDNPKIANRTMFAAITSVNQPSVVPVLQLHVPNATAADSDNIQQFDPSAINGINGSPTSGTGQWTIRPTKTEVNVYFVAGNSPSRSDRTFRKSSTMFKQAADTTTPTTAGETGGGLANFVRFLENWEDVPIKISGGFIQNTRSRYATAPWAVAPALSGVSDLTSIFLNPAQPRADANTVTGRVLTGYNLQYMSATINRIPYYTPPIRLWGYDVGLLTQQPDRFAERFASPIAGSNEFFREVSADDPWVETLLCALEPDIITANSAKGIGVVPSNYKTRALRGKDLRPACNSKVNNKFKYGGEGNTLPATTY